MTDRHQSNLEQLSAHLSEGDGAQRSFVSHSARRPSEPYRALSNAAYVAAVSQHLDRLRRQPREASRRNI